MATTHGPSSGYASGQVTVNNKSVQQKINELDKVLKQPPKLNLKFTKVFDEKRWFFKWSYYVIANTEHPYEPSYNQLGGPMSYLHGNFAQYQIRVFPDFLLSYRVSRIKKKIKKKFDTFQKVWKTINFHDPLEEELYG